MVSSGQRNTGEWCEFPAGLEAIRQGVVVANKPLKELIAESKTGLDLIYEFDSVGNLMLNGKSVLSIKEYITMREILYQGMQKTGRVKAIPKFDSFWARIGYPKLKAGSAPKADLIFRNSVGLTVSLSVKSLLGKKPTLLNPGKITTKIRYQINGPLPLARTNNKAMWKQLNNLTLHSYGSDTFKNNLTKISGSLPKILAEVLADYFTGGSSKFEDMSKSHCAELEKLILASASGMVPNTAYNFSRPVTKILIVKNRWDFEVVDLDDRVTIKSFVDMFKFDQPSRSVKKYDYGFIYSKNGTNYIDFVVQVRMK